MAQGESQQGRMHWPLRVYWPGGVLACMLVAAVFALSQGRESLRMLLGFVASELVIIAWMVEGVIWHRQQRKAQQEAVERAERERMEQEQTRREMRKIYARRTTSYGGRTIAVHRTPSARAAVESARETSGASSEPPAKGPEA